MKPYCLALAAVFSLGQTYAQHFTLRGHISGQDTGMLTLQFTDIRGNAMTDTQYLDKGSFVFGGELNSPTPAYLQGRVHSRSMDDPHFLQLFLEPGPMDLAMDKDDFHQHTLKGCPTQDDLDAVNKTLAPVFARIQELKDTHGTEEQFDSAQAVYQAYEIHYADSHPNAYISPYLLWIPIANKRIPIDSAVKLFDRLNVRVQSSDVGKIVAKNLEEQFAAATGKAAHDFVLTGMDGQPFRLSSFKGRDVVLVDFWASWCVPCRDFTPHLKDLAARYGGKGLTILTVSVDEHREAWERAIKQDNMERLSNLFAGNSAGDLRAWFSVGGIPADILIDKDGNIAGRYLAAGAGSAQDLDKKLAALLP